MPLDIEIKTQLEGTVIDISFDHLLLVVGLTDENNSHKSVYLTKNETLELILALKKAVVEFD